MSGLTAPAETGFEIGNYLEERNAKTDLVMVEVGHGAHPVAYQQPFEFTGDRAYIGLEAWLRAEVDERPKDLEKLRKRKQSSDHNIFYLNQGVDCQSRLPQGAADEVLLSNVLSDPFIDLRAENLLGQAAKLAGDTGTIVLREVITPSYSRAKDPAVLKAAGLQVKLKAGRNDDLWDELEELYRGNRTVPPRSGSYYLFLSKN
jgi:hypothetical protein